jgi:hypothetical protein
MNPLESILALGLLSLYWWIVLSSHNILFVSSSLSGECGLLPEVVGVVLLVGGSGLLISFLSVSSSRNNNFNLQVYLRLTS